MDYDNVGISNETSYTETVHDDGDRLFKLETTNNIVDGKVESTSWEFSINLNLMFGDEHKTGVDLSVGVGVSTDLEVSASAKGKASVYGKHADVAAGATVGSDHIATVDAHVGVGDEHNTFGLGGSTGLNPFNDTINVYGYHTISQGDLESTTKVKGYIRSGMVEVVAVVFFGMYYMLMTGDPVYLQYAQQMCEG